MIGLWIFAALCSLGLALIAGDLLHRRYTPPSIPADDVDQLVATLHTAIGGGGTCTISHNLGLRAVLVSAYEDEEPYERIFPDPPSEILDRNTVSLNLTALSPYKCYRIVITGAR